jgi:hypothetical protein
VQFAKARSHGGGRGRAVNRGCGGCAVACGGCASCASAGWYVGDSGEGRKGDNPLYRLDPGLYLAALGRCVSVPARGWE